jgi:hypothetical protein
MALTGRRPAEIFFTATFSLPRKKLPYPALLFNRRNETAQEFSGLETLNRLPRELNRFTSPPIARPISLSRHSPVCPLEPLLPTLKELYLFGCKLDDLLPEVCANSDDENVLDKVRAHYETLSSDNDAEVKVLFLGNGGVGKTQLCRRLRDLEFDPNIPYEPGPRTISPLIRPARSASQFDYPRTVLVALDSLC